MIVLYVYGIVDAPRFDTGTLLGHGDEPVFPLPSGTIAAAASTVAATPIPPSIGNVWRHERVLEALMKRHAVLPVRFGTVLAAADGLLSLLEKRGDAFGRDLHVIRGKVEIALRLSSSSSDRDPIPSLKSAPRRPMRPGTAYLLARLDRQRRGESMHGWARDAQLAIRSCLDPLSVDGRWEPARDPALPIKASYLVRRDRMGVFVEAMEGIARRRPDIRIAYTGPWPPYSFVTERSFGEGIP